MSLTDYEIDERFLQSHTLSFKVPASDLKTLDLKEDAKIELGPGDYFYITEIHRIREEEKADWEVLAETSWMKLADLKRPGNFTLVNVTPQAGLDAILAGTPWTSLQVIDGAAAFSMDVSDATVLDLIWQWAKICICEVSFQVRTKQVNLITRVGAVKPLSFRYGRNLLTVKRTSKAPSCTRLYVYGRDDMSITSLTSGGVPYIEDYTYYTSQGVSLGFAQTEYRKDEIYSDDTFTDEQTLYNAALHRLSILAQPTIIYECTVVDLSQLIGTSDYDYKCGDTVRVYDGPLGIDVAARVTRKVTYPYEPEKNKIELSFGELLQDDPNHVSNTRPNSGMDWEMFESNNRTTVKQIRNFSQIIHRIRLNTTAKAEWIMGFKLKGVGVNSSTVTVTAIDDETGIPFWSGFSTPVTNGLEVDLNFTFGQKDVPVGVHTLSIRATSNTALAGINLAVKSTAFWVLARGTTREEITLPNSIRFDYTAALQNWIVPDGVFEVQVEAVGGSGSHTTYGGKGGRVVAKFPVTPSASYDVYVGGHPVAGGANTAGGWPDGGDGDSVGSAIQSGGGSSTQLRLAGDTQANSLIIAGGGGGAGDPDGIGGIFPTGGDGGFYAGTDGTIASFGRGATQEAPGAGGANTNPGEAGDTDGPGYGGDAGDQVNFFGWPGGGGGGGFHGGGGAGGSASAPAQCGGGGGGSGKLGPSGSDLEFSDGYNPAGAQGYMIISWETPAVL